MISKKIKEQRLLLGLTQEDLAAKTQLSVRTIQRIESGEVDPRTYTLQVLAEALQVDLDFLTREKLPKEMDDNKFLSLLHLSGLFVFILPPVIFWLWKKEALIGYEQHYTDVMNFQLSILIYIMASLVLSVVIIGLFLLPIIGIFSTIIIIMNTVKVANGEAYRYPFSLKIIK